MNGSEAARRRGNVPPRQCLAIILNTIRVPGHHFGRHSSYTCTNLPSTSLHPRPASYQLITTSRHRHHRQQCLNLVRSSLLQHTGSTRVRRYSQAHFDASSPLSQTSPRTVEQHLHLPSFATPIYQAVCCSFLLRRSFLSTEPSNVLPG
jgi:hypothetical protein